MKTLLLTGYDDNLREIGDITSRIMADYATKHRIDFLRVRQYEADSHPSWQKAEHVHRQLKSGYDRVIWMDADTLITNMDKGCPVSLTNPIHCSKDWGTDALEPWHFNMGNFIAYKDRLGMWEKLWCSQFGVRGKKQWRNQPLWEQSAIQEFHRENMDLQTFVRVHDRRTFNAVHSELAPSAPEPWQPGDWLCHLTGEEITNEKRMVVLKKLIEAIYP